MTTLIPTLGNIAVILDKPEAMLSNGLIIPEQARAVQDTATVVSVSAGSLNRKGRVIPHDVAVGDKILLAVKFAGAEVLHEGEKIVIVPISEVAAVLA